MGERIKKARLDIGLSQAELAQAMNQIGENEKISRVAITLWETGTTKRMGAHNLFKVAKILNVNPEWLLLGAGSKNFFAGSINNKIVPVLNPSQLAKYPEIPDADILYLTIDKKLAEVSGPDLFAIILEDDRMSPDLKPNDIIIIDPSVNAMPGEIILTELEKEKAFLVARYSPYEKTNTNSLGFKLVPSNSYWPTVIVNSQNPGKIIGTVVERRDHRRL